MRDISKKYLELISAELNSWDLSSKEMKRVYKLAGKFLDINKNKIGIYKRKIYTMHKDNKWAKQIISLQDEEGKWGYFHTLSSDSKSPVTTEKALKRLEILGYTIEDNCIKNAVSYMNDCLVGIKDIPDRREKLHDWDIFTSLLLAAWIRRFTTNNDSANEVAEKWAKVISTAFRNGEYNHQEYRKAYYEVLGMNPKGGRLINFVNFYGVSIIKSVDEYWADDGEAPDWRKQMGIGKVIV